LGNNMLGHRLLHVVKKSPNLHRKGPTEDAWGEVASLCRK